jgi:hypothetical protein
VLRSAGYYVDRPTRAEVDPANYAPRVVTPTLMLGGEHDNTMFPYTTSQAPFFRQLGTPAADKMRIGYESSHFVPLEDGIRETLAWVDHYLSGRNAQARSTPARQ